MSEVDPGREYEVASLRDFLDPVIPGGIVGDLQMHLISGGRSNPTYRLSDNTRQWILRRQPFGQVLETAHDMGREYRVITALHNTGVAVPQTLVYCADPNIIGSTFYVMTDLGGITMRNVTDTSIMTVDERGRLAEAMVKTLVNLHQLDPASIGLADFGRPDGYLERQVRRWRKQWDASHLVSRPRVYLLLDRLGASVPETVYPGLIHGDFKVDNIMVDQTDRGHLLGVLDWEMSTLGDTLADVGTLLSFWDEEDSPFNPVSAGTTAHQGFPSHDAIRERYAQLRGIELPNLDWYLVLAYVKVAIIMEQIHARHEASLTVGEGFDDAGAMVDPLLDKAMKVASVSNVPGLRV
jgi:aminoglycoside phosphotransferase (APT) family kinase protein